MLKKSIIAVSALVLAACGGSTAMYQPASASSGSGYISAPAGNDRYTVKYTGGKGMAASQVAEFALLRAAELTLENGDEWFAILSSTTEEVAAGQANDLQARAGPNLSGGNVSAGGGSGETAAGPGVGDAAPQTGPNLGGFGGGGDVPYQVLERWNAPIVTQTVLIIQTGSGDEASFEGVTSQPEILSAATTRSEIRAKMVAE